MVGGAMGLRLAMLSALAVVGLGGGSSAAACKNPSLDVATFISRWNGAVEKLTTGTWKLPEYKKLGFIRQNLDTADLILAASVDKDGCISKLEIRSSRELATPMAGLVAWSTAVRVTSPQASVDDRKAIIEKLGIHKPALEAGGKASLAGMAYEFSEDAERNILSITSE